MSTPNERTIAIGQGRIEPAISWWRNGWELVKSEPEPRATAYRHAVDQVLTSLQSVQNVPRLITAYSCTADPSRWHVLSEACDVDAGGFPLNKGIVEDASYYARFLEMVAASQRAV